MYLLLDFCLVIWYVYVFSIYLLLLVLYYGLINKILIIVGGILYECIDRRVYLFWFLVCFWVFVVWFGNYRVV